MFQILIYLWSMQLSVFTILQLINTCLPNIYDVLWDLVPFVQFKKREKHSWRSVTFRKVVGF